MSNIKSVSIQDTPENRAKAPGDQNVVIEYIAVPPAIQGRTIVSTLNRIGQQITAQTNQKAQIDVSIADLQDAQTQVGAVVNKAVVN